MDKKTCQVWTCNHARSPFPNPVDADTQVNHSLFLHQMNLHEKTDDGRKEDLIEFYDFFPTHTNHSTTISRSTELLDL